MANGAVVMSLFTRAGILLLAPGIGYFLFYLGRDMEGPSFINYYWITLVCLVLLAGAIRIVDVSWVFPLLVSLIIFETMGGVRLWWAIELGRSNTGYLIATMVGAFLVGIWGMHGFSLGSGHGGHGWWGGCGG